MDDRGTIAVGQASHAWVSGQLARAWGNRRFGPVEPYEEVCLAAEQHDVGMARWDLAPSRNPDTGLPHSFIEMPLAVHLGLWRAGPPRLLTQCRYAALLVSMHGRRLYEVRDLSKLDAADVQAVHAFLAERRAFEQRLLASLLADQATSASATDQLLARNSQLLWIWDFISLALVLDWAPCKAKSVPTAVAAEDLRLAPTADPGRCTLEPWPFRADTVVLRCEGRRLPRGYDDEQALQDALERAPWETIEFELSPGRDGR
ncbi:MAG: DUF3891 family protein [Solirubrobacterales bacterium]|nr:DUF3891 family protein [Solirubrobacterales bacterium]